MTKFGKNNRKSQQLNFNKTFFAWIIIDIIYMRPPKRFRINQNSYRYLSNLLSNLMHSF